MPNCPIISSTGRHRVGAGLVDFHSLYPCNSSHIADMGGGNQFPVSLN